MRNEFYRTLSIRGTNFIAGPFSILYEKICLNLSGKSHLFLSPSLSYAAEVGNNVKTDFIPDFLVTSFPLESSQV
jgi:hypothetical protein